MAPQTGPTAHFRLLWSTQTRAQLSTEPLAVTSVCAGAQLDVTGFRNGTADSYGIELSSDGATYFEVPSTVVSTSGRYEITYRATIPANTAPGTSYRVRFISKNPDVKGSPSTSLLTVKARPAPPTVDALITDCQRILPSGDLTSIIPVTITPGASATLYDEKLVSQFTKTGSNSGSAYVGFDIPKDFLLGLVNYVYPVKETTYYVSQSLERL